MTDALVVTRVLDAPREAVWAAWTEPDRLSAWYGPKGHTLSSCTMDVRPGGSFLYAMRGADGGDGLERALDKLGAHLRSKPT